MANINKNELYNLICEFYEDNDGASALWKNGYSMREWASLLGVSIAPATITTLVREGLLVAEDIEESHPRRTVKYYRKAYTLEEKQAHEARMEKYRLDEEIENAKKTVEGYEDRKRRAYAIYEKCVADAEWCLKETLADYEQWYNEAVAFLHSHSVNV